MTPLFQKIYAMLVMNDFSHEDIMLGIKENMEVYKDLIDEEGGIIIFARDHGFKQEIKEIKEEASA